jgi:hypothetical protein
LPKKIGRHYKGLGPLIPVSKGVEKLKFSISVANNLAGRGLLEIIYFIRAFIKLLRIGGLKYNGQKNTRKLGQPAGIFKSLELALVKQSLLS